MDAISNVLTPLRSGSAILAKATLKRPWGISVDPMRSPAIHVVLGGECWLRLAGDKQPLRLLQGDALLVAGGVGHTLSDAPDSKVMSIREALSIQANVQETVDIETTALLCAKYQLDDGGPHPMVSLMPPLIHLTRRQIGANEPLRLALELLRVEAKNGRAGTDIIAPRLMDSALVLMLRAWIDNQPEGTASWFGALRDPAVARALRLIHEQPTKPWTVAILADAASLSRATFARRFTSLVGEPPLAYLMRWRINLAAKALCETRCSVDEIARAVGYESGPAFSKAFRRLYGEAPGRYRSGQTDRV
jgi:AraC-like DNA-binding protein